MVAGDFGDDFESDFDDESDFDELSLDELDFSEEEELDESLEDELELSEFADGLELDELPLEFFDASRLSLR